MTAFPATLSDVTINYGFSALRSGVRQQMESGRHRQVRSVTVDREDFTVQWKFTPDQLHIFQDWYENDIGQGEDWFTIDLELGEGMEECEARIIGGGYSCDWRDGLWEVSATLEVNDPPIMTESELDALLG